MTIAYRDALADDRRFVVSTWSASFKNAHSAGMIAAADWADVMRPQIAKVLDRPDARTVVAFENTDPSFVYGFIAGDVSVPTSPLVFYVYVKEPYRRAGYARGLFAALGVDPSKPFEYACRTAIVSKLASKIPGARWAPLVVRYPKEQPRRTG